MFARSCLSRVWVSVAAGTLAFHISCAFAQDVPATPVATAVKASGTLTGNGAAVPAAAADAVAAPRLVEADYRIGHQDLMEITVYGQPELTRSIRVSTQGSITLPLVGQVVAVGLTAQQLEQRIAEKLGEKFLQDPQVTVFIKEYTTLRFAVEGAVNKPGLYPLTGQMTLLRALAVAGGQGGLSDLSEVMLFRISPSGERRTLVFDVERIRSGEVPDPSIQNDDLLVVKRSKARTALKDSLLGDVLQTLVNPFSFLR